MNRPFSPRRRYRNSLVQGGSGVALGAVALVVILLVGFRFIAPAAWGRITSPLWHTGGSLATSITGMGTIDSKSSLRAQRDTYASQVATLTNQNAALAAKVTDLTNLLGTRTQPSPGIVAAVLARPPVAPYDVLVLDQGSSAGVALGALVSGNGGTPIGTIGQVDSAQSRVTLFSTHGIQTPGWIGESRIPVTLTGASAGAYTASVPKIAGVKVGDGVYLASAGAYPVGTVVRIDSDPSSPTVSVDMRPYANPFSLSWVTVAK